MEMQIKEYIKQNYISKNKIRLKIKELELIIKNTKEHYKGTYALTDDYKEAIFAKEYLQELLEEGG